MTEAQDGVEFDNENSGSLARKKSNFDTKKAAVAALLASNDGSLDDKLATVKTAHHIDKDRVQSAFRFLMKGR
jgi:hypothetical protein